MCTYFVHLQERCEKYCRRKKGQGSGQGKARRQLERADPGPGPSCNLIRWTKKRHRKKSAQETCTVRAQSGENEPADVLEEAQVTSSLYVR